MPLTPALENLRRHDRDRFLASLFLPAEWREGMWTVLAFMLEIARIRETVQEPVLGEIRLQWWREALEEIYTDKPVRKHQEVEALAEAIKRHKVSRSPFEALLEARALDLDPAPPADLPALERYLHATAGLPFIVGLEMAGQAQASDAPQSLSLARHAALAYGLVGVVRAVPYYARHGKVWLPEAMLKEQGLNAADVLEGRESQKLQRVIAELLTEAERHLVEARAGRELLRPETRRVFLPTVVSEYYSQKLQKKGLVATAEAGGFSPLLMFRLWRRANQKSY